MKLPKSFRKPQPDRSAIPDFGRYRTYLSSKDIGVQIETKESAIQFLSEIDIAVALPYLSRLNVGLQASGLDSYRDFRELHEFLFDEDLSTRVARELQTRRSEICLTPLHFKTAIAALIRFGSDTGVNSLDEPSVRHYLGKLIFQGPDIFLKHFGEAEFEGENGILALELSLRHTGYATDQRRLEAMSQKGFVMNEILSSPELRERFEQTLGFDQRQFLTGIVAILAHVHGQTAEFASQSNSTAINYEYLMAQAGVRSTAGEFIRSTYSIAIPDGVPINREGNFMSILADRPLALREGQLICMDLEFLQDKVSRGLWNLARKVAQDGGIEGKFDSDAGYAFEQYCASRLEIWEENRKKSGAKLYRPEKTDKEFFDALYVEGDTAVVFEFKSGMLPVSSVFGESVDTLAESINQKFITGTFGNKQGFKQIADNLSNLSEMKKRYSLDGITQFIPCLIVLDETLTNAGGYTYAVRESAKLFEGMGPEVSRPIIIHSEDLSILAIRCRAINPIILLRRLRDQGILTVGTTKNFFLDSFPDKKIHPALRVDVGPETHFFDEAIENITSGYEPTPSEPCELCGEETKMVTDHEGRKRWWCSSCKKLSSTEIDADKITEINAHVEKMVRRYRDS